MTLVLNVRDVARTNIERFDDLGAFATGETTCAYHYDTGKHCAIGVCDTQMVLRDDSTRVDIYVYDGTVQTDDEEILQFIQDLHDFKATGVSVSQDWAYCAPSAEIEELCTALTCRDDLTPDLYKKIMGLIVELPGQWLKAELEKRVEGKA